MMEELKQEGATPAGESKKTWSWKGWQAFVALWLTSMMSHCSPKYISAVLSTVERHFGLKTKYMSAVFTGQYMTSVVLALPLVFYFNNRNKAFWTGMGQVSVAVAGALPVLAFLAIPAVHQVEDLVVEEVDREVELCLADNKNGVLSADEESAFGAPQVAALALFLLWKLMMGVAITTYWTLGV